MSVVEPDGQDRAGSSAPTTARPATRVNGKQHARRDLPAGRSALHRPRHACRCCGTRSGSTIVNNESAEIIRMLNSAFDAFTDDAHRLLSGRAARRDRPHQRARLRERQQRRLSRRLRHHAGGLRGSVPRRCSPRSTSSRSGCRASAISPATRSPRPTGGCSPRWCASTRSISATSNAICAASPTIRTCRTICAISIRCRASPRP